MEKRTQLNFLAREGCHSCQGYLLCPPLPAAQFERWVAGCAKAAPKRMPAKAGMRKASRKE